ncbi:MAG: hypothetical protein FJ295_13245 [Planctomycetes bacterium]|nr:hypothetical protein [Planctomycetota bacterium]
MSTIQRATTDSTAAAAAISPARRLAQWTTNLLFTALVIVLAVALGRNVIYWWKPSATARPLTEQARDVIGFGELGAEKVSHDIRFGDSPLIMRRDRVRGSIEEAMRRLEDETVRLGVASQTARRGLATLPPEQQSELQRNPPRSSAPGQWDLYLGTGPLPMAWLVADANTAVEDDAAAAPQRIILAWGLILPYGETEDEWGIFAWGASAGSDPTSDYLARIALPPNSRRMLSVSNPSGAALITFQGTATRENWREFYRDWFARNDWTIVIPWSDHRDASAARFQNRDGDEVDLELLSDGPAVRGLLVPVSPPASSPASPLDTPREQGESANRTGETRRTDSTTNSEEP